MLKQKITYKDANQRIDKYVKKYFSNAPLSFIYKLFRKKDVKINNHWVKENYILKENDEISIYVTTSQMEDFIVNQELKKKEFPYQIVYEDKNVLIVNKPRGILVHGDINEKEKTLTNDVLNYLYLKDEYNPRIDIGFTPGPAHRLDRNTAGLVIFGKNVTALQILQDLFKDKKEIEKHYIALVCHPLNQNMEINAQLLKDEKTKMVKVSNAPGSKSALTIVKPIKKYNDFTLVDIKLVTGRTHQIRVHMNYINHPVVGDNKYGDFKINKQIKQLYKFDDQFLQAYEIEFKNISGELSYLSNKKFSCELAKEFSDLLNKLS